MNVENKSQVVKKEVFSFTIGDSILLKPLENLTIEAKTILTSFVAACFYAEYVKKQSNYDRNGFQTSFDKISFCFDFKIDDVRQAAQELEEKGYLFRDADGCLAFTPTGSVQ